LSGCAKTAPATSPEEAFSTSRLEYLRPRTGVRPISMFVLI